MLDGNGGLPFFTERDLCFFGAFFRKREFSCREAGSRQQVYCLYVGKKKAFVKRGEKSAGRMSPCSAAGQGRRPSTGRVSVAVWALFAMAVKHCRSECVSCRFFRPSSAPSCFFSRGFRGRFSRGHTRRVFLRPVEGLDAFPDGKVTDPRPWGKPFLQKREAMAVAPQAILL